MTRVPGLPDSTARKYVDDATKGKKTTRRRSARAYVNINRLDADQIRQRLAAVAEYTPSDEDESPAQAAARPSATHAITPRCRQYHEEGHEFVNDECTDHMVPDAVKAGMAGSVGQMRWPVGGAQPENTPGAARMVENGRPAGSASRVAWDHPDLKEHSLSFGGLLARLQSNLGQYRGQSSNFSYTDRPAGAPGDEAYVHGFDAAQMTGSYRNMPPVGHSPQRPDFHTARDGQSNGGHSLGNPTTMDRPAMKSMTPFQIMQAHMRGELDA